MEQTSPADTRRAQPGAVKPDEERKVGSITIPLTGSLKEKLLVKAVSDGVTMAEVGRRALDAYL
jgi:hypothetical protein